jgi:hypothetical protein
MCGNKRYFFASLAPSLDKKFGTAPPNGILGMGYLVWDAWYGILGMGYLVWNTWYGILGMGYLVWDTWYGILGMGVNILSCTVVPFAVPYVEI